MAFTRGKSGNPQGRPSGTINRASQDLREHISNLLEDRYEQLLADLDMLEPKDRVKVYVDLLQYSIPKLQSTPMLHDQGELTGPTQINFVFAEKKSNPNT